MTRVHAALRAAADALARAGVPDPMVDAALLLSSLTDTPPLTLRAEGWRELDDARQAAYTALVARRAAREPLQYILGEAPFMGRMLRVTADTLIPRADTEVVCEWALHTPAPSALDLCTGTGALAISLALAWPESVVMGGDISEGALAVARENARHLGARVAFRQGDLFAPFRGLRFALITANPPYIPTPALATLQEEVQREPRLALDGGADGLDFYRRIAREAGGYLLSGGRLLLEIGEGQAADVAALLRAGGFTEIAVRRDLQGLERAVAARFQEGTEATA